MSKSHLLNAYLWIFLSVCVDDDFLLHVIGFCGIYYIIKNIQKNVSRNKTKFRRSCSDTFQVLVIGHHVPWLSTCPLIDQYVLWLVIMYIFSKNVTNRQTWQILQILSYPTSTAKFMWAAQTKKGTAYKLVKLHDSSWIFM